MNAEREYGRLLATFPERRPGWGRELHRPGRSAQPMTYALVAWSEARASWPHDDARGRRAIDWLLRNADLDGDGLVGWGLPQAWDAFGDGVGAAGSTNPPNHPYTITTSLVLYALAAASEAGWLDGGRRRRAVEHCTAVLDRWTQSAMSPVAGGAYFWYSPHPADAKFCPNVSSMMAGALVAATQSGLLTGSASAESAVDAAIGGVVAAARPGSGAPRWQYIQGDAPGRPNDAVHHAYTLWGIEEARAGARRISIPWSTEDALSSLEPFLDGDVLRELPRGTSGDDEPMRLWGAGMLLAFMARHGPLARAERLTSLVLRAYGGADGPRHLPTSPPGGRSARHAAHVLLGLAELGRAQRRAVAPGR